MTITTKDLMGHAKTLGFLNQHMKKIDALGIEVLDIPITEELFHFFNTPSSLSIDPKKPKTNISWTQAILWANKLSTLNGLSPFYKQKGQTHEFEPRMGEGYRLPTLQEYMFLVKNIEPSLKHEFAHTKEKVACTQPVATLKPSEHGLYDLLGNTWEWLWDTHTSAKRYTYGGSFKDSLKVDPINTISAYREYDNVSFRVCRTI